MKFNSIHVHPFSYSWVSPLGVMEVSFYSSFFSRFRMKKWKKLTNSVFLLRCLTQLALCQTVNHDASSIIITIATIRDSFFKNILSAKKNGSLRNLNPLSAYCCLSPYRACGVVGQSPTLISPKRFFIAEFIAILLVCSDDESPLP